MRVCAVGFRNAAVDTVGFVAGRLISATLSRRIDGGLGGERPRRGDKGEEE